MASSYTLTKDIINLNDFVTHYADFEHFPTNATIAQLFITPTCRITIYHSGKILFQGKGAEKEYQRWAITSPQSVTKILSAYIGCDETGVGDYFAPLVTASCYVDSEIINQLNTLNIKDSKQLTDEYICQIAPIIKQVVPHSIFALTNEQYNKLVDNGYNAHAIKAFVHNKTIGQLIHSCQLPPSIDIVMDQFATLKNYQKYLKNITPIYLPTIFETKAENKYIGVACASILARNHFLQLLEHTNQKYQTQIPLGAGNKVDMFGKNFLTKYGLDAFKKNVKWHFANTDKIMNK